MTTARRENGASSYDDPPTGYWPKKRVIWACDWMRGKLLTRYFLLRTPVFAVYLHHLHVSDEDRALHDHPWSFVTFLLSSGYYEWTPVGQGVGAVVRTWRRRFSVLYRPATWQHRLELVKPTWTLVLRFRTVRDWGFITPDGWLDWRSYGKRWCD
jgi:hypothetical protein